MSFHYDPYIGFQHEVLPNGLTVFAKETDNPWLYVGFVVHVGAREDPTGRDGMFHVIEHLVSENVDEWTFPDLEKHFQALGGYGQFGEVDYLSTSYSFFVPADEAVLDDALSLFGRMLLAGKLTRNIEQEKAVITREFYLDYPFAQKRTWNLASYEALFEDHPRLCHYDTPLGTLVEFASCTPEELQASYDLYYVPANISVVCIGGYHVPDLVQALQKSPFGMQKPGCRNALPAPFALSLPKKHELIVSLREWTKLSYTRTECSFEWALPLTFGPYQVRILKALLSQQLHQVLRYEQTLTYNVQVNAVFYQDCRVLRIKVDVPPDAVKMTEETIWNTLRSLHTVEGTFYEMKRKSLNPLQLPDYSGSDLLGFAMQDLETYQCLHSFEEEIKHIEQVTFDEVVELANYLTPERHFHLIIQP